MKNNKYYWDKNSKTLFRENESLPIYGQIDFQSVNVKFPLPINEDILSIFGFVKDIKTLSFINGSIVIVSKLSGFCINNIQINDMNDVIDHCDSANVILNVDESNLFNVLCDLK